MLSGDAMRTLQFDRTKTWLRRFSSGMAKIARRAIAGQVFALTLGVALVLGGVALVPMLFLVSSRKEHGLSLLALVFVVVIAYGVRSMAFALLQEPSPSLTVEQRPLPMGFWSLSTALQSFVRYTRATRQILAEQAHTQRSLALEVRCWIRQLEGLRARDRRVLEERGLNVRELARCRHRFDGSEAPNAADGCREFDAMLRDVEDRLFGDPNEHPLRRGAS